MDSIFIRIPHELSQTAESSRFEGEVELGPFTQGTDVYVFDEPVRYCLDLTNTSGALLATGTVEGVAHTACARCLEEASVPVSGEMEGYYLLPDSDRELSEEDQEEYQVLADSSKMDIAPLISAAISLDLPLVPLCREDCEGLCARCGANLNEGPCPCQDEPDDDNPFAVLKNIKFD